MTIFFPSAFTNYSNGTFNSSTTATPNMPVWLRLFTLSCMILIDVSAFLGNLLVICAFYRTRRLQTVTNYFIASLAFADALVAIFVLPLSIYCYQRDRSWKLGLILCDLWVSSDVLLCTSSILNLACISVDRYMAITKPLTYTAYRSKFLARMMILLVWIVSVVITCPPIFGWRDKNRRQTVEEEHRCDLNSARGYVLYSALGSFYIPGVVMVFVYIRIFMVVYDRENLIKRFHNSTPATNNNPQSSLMSKANPNGTVSNTPTISKNKRKFQRIPACCCFCFRNKSRLTTTPSSHYPAPGIEQKQNGYLVYRFTNNSNNNGASHNNSTSPQRSPSTKPRASFFSRPCSNSAKPSTNQSDDLYQYRRHYLGCVPDDYQVRKDDSSCSELRPFEKLIIPLTKCRSRSFEHTELSRIRDLNAELSRSRQLKAAATVAAAASISTTPANPRNALHYANQCDRQLSSSSSTAEAGRLFPSITANSPQTTQSLHQLNDLSSIQETPKYRKARKQNPHELPMRSKTTTNPPKIREQSFGSPSSSPSSKPRQSVPEPTRINRRAKSARPTNTSPSAILLENIKQQHRIMRNPSVLSSQSCKSLASIRQFTFFSDASNDPRPQSKCSWCCCCCCCHSSSVNRVSQNLSKQVFAYTPNHSVTIDDDDDEKISSTDTTNRAPLYVPIASSSVARASSTGNGVPGDVHRRERIRFMKEQKTAKTLAVVVGGFILLWLPFFIMYVIPQEKYLFNPHTVTLITWLGYFNSVINPFIYAYCSKQFRMAFWNIIFGVCMKRSSALLPLGNKNKQLHQRRLNA